MLPPMVCALSAAQQMTDAAPPPLAHWQLNSAGSGQTASIFGGWQSPVAPGSAQRGAAPSQLRQLNAAVQEGPQGSAAVPVPASAMAAAAAAASKLLSAAEAALQTAGGPAQDAAADVIDLTVDSDDDEPAVAPACPPAFPVAAVAIQPPVRTANAGLHTEVLCKGSPEPGGAVQPPPGPQAPPCAQPTTLLRCRTATTVAVLRPGASEVLAAQEGHDLFVPAALADASDPDAPSWLPLVLLFDQSSAIPAVPAGLCMGLVPQPDGAAVRQYYIPTSGVSELLRLSSKRDSLGRLRVRFTARCTPDTSSWLRFHIQIALMCDRPGIVHLCLIRL